MSRPIPGIQGVPFRKVVSREPDSHSAYVVEKLACGHEHLALKGARATKRRCYRCSKTTVSQ